MLSSDGRPQAMELAGGRTRARITVLRAIAPARHVAPCSVRSAQKCRCPCRHDTPLLTKAPSFWFLRAPPPFFMNLQVCFTALIVQLLKHSHPTPRHPRKTWGYKLATKVCARIWREHLPPPSDGRCFCVTVCVFCVVGGGGWLKLQFLSLQYWKLFWKKSNMLETLSYFYIYSINKEMQFWSFFFPQYFTATI